MLSREVSGADAAAWGMIYRCVPDAELDEASAELVADLAGRATIAIGLTKHCINESLHAPLTDAMANEAFAPRAVVAHRPTSAKVWRRSRIDVPPTTRAGRARSTMTFETITYEVADRIATITFNRPDQLNAVSPQMVRELQQAYAAAEADPDVWISIITGSGSRVLRRRRRGRDPRRRPGHLRRALPHDLPAVGGPAGGDAALPHDDQADPDRGERALLRRRARPGHDGRHRRSRRTGPSSSIRT